jgi:hypothetical protein
MNFRRVFQIFKSFLFFAFTSPRLSRPASLLPGLIFSSVMNTLAQGKSMISGVYLHKPIDWLGETLPDNERIIFSRIKLQIHEFLNVEILNTEFMLKIIDEINQAAGVSMYLLKEVVELIRIKLLSSNPKKVYLTITLVSVKFSLSSFLLLLHVSLLD